MRILLVTLLASNLLAPAQRAAQPFCLVSKEVERTVEVPPAVARELLRTTRSYRGRCALYGTARPLGAGSMRTYVQAEPMTVGVTFPASTLKQLPQAMSDGRVCFDANGDGRIDRESECAVGHARELDLPRSGTPYKWVLANWNPMGHLPVGVYNVPHFDFHFYLVPPIERNAIRPGPCPIMTNCDDYARAKVPVPPRYSHPDFADVDAVEPAMGNHLIDLAAPEFHGRAFTHTWIYGAYGGAVTFHETMITKAWFESRRDTCAAIKLPRAWKSAGWYPTSYCIEYRDNRDDYTVSLTGFVHRDAS
ncbi:hypothetical protein ACIBG8_33010 [Nonomuraea sp. NPDC050556]|uniref:hypothetical protein n=1 Tax=Nonomuraea sp. NPDC050556 TaxID=3364369 RepID=UPI0037A58DAE